jgi:hypothetical protein
LNFHDDSTKGLSLELLRLYQFAQDQNRQGDFDISLKILTELRDTWQQVFNSDVKAFAN